MSLLGTVTAAELQDLLESKKSHHGLKIIDARWDDTKSTARIREEYDQEHIPFAIFYNHESVSDHSQQTPQAFPKLTDFVRYMNKVSISVEDDVIIYGNDDVSFSAEYCAFVFKYFGHVGKVYILQGGFKEWKKSGSCTEISRKDLAISDTTLNTYTPRGNADVTDSSVYQVDVSEVLNCLDSIQTQIIDCREPQIFHGETLDISYYNSNEKLVEFSGHRRGHIPGAINVPFSVVSSAKDSDTLRQIFIESGVDLSQRILLIARGGINPAPFISFKLRELGVSSEIVRDGMCCWCIAQGSSFPLISSSDLYYSERKRIIVWSLPNSQSDTLKCCLKMHPEIQIYESLMSSHVNSSTFANQSGRSSLRKAAYNSMLEILSVNAEAKVNVTIEQCHNYINAEIEDAWLKSFNHIILVRDPEAMCASEWRTSARGNECIENINTLSYKNSFEILSRLKRIGATSLVLDADLDVVQSPKLALEHVCDFVGVEYKKSMFNWDDIQLDIQSAMNRQVDLAHITVEEDNVHEDISQEISRSAADVKPYYEAIVWNSVSMRKSWPICRQSPSSQNIFNVLICGSSYFGNLDLLSCMTASFFSNSTIFAFHHEEFESVEDKCPYLFDLPLVVCGEVEAVLQMLKVMDAKIANGYMCVVRALIITDKIPAIKSLAYPVSMIRTQEDVLSDVFMQDIFKLIVSDIESSKVESEVTFAEGNKSIDINFPNVHWRDLSKLIQRCDEVDNVAVADLKGSYRLTEIYARSLKVDEILTKYGCTSGDHVAIYLESSASSTWAALGSLLCECVFADVPTWYRSTDLERVLGIIKPKVILTSDALSKNISDTEKASVVVLSKEMDDFKCVDSIFKELHPTLNAANKPDTGGFCVLTSGTTGVSKVVCCPQASLTDSHPIFEKILREGDRVGSFWVYYYFLIPILSGCTFVIIPSDFFLKPKELCDYVKEKKITVLFLTPSILESCLINVPDEIFRQSFDSVHTLMLTGERFRDQIRDSFLAKVPTCKVVNIYSTNESGDLAIYRDGYFQIREGTRARILDESGRAVLRGNIGHLFVQKQGLLTGYWTEHGKSSMKNDWYDTGDLVRWLGGDKITFESRANGAHVKIRGFKVSPRMVQDLLLQHTSIKTAKVSVFGGEDGSEISLVAAISLTQDVNESISETAIREWMQARAPHYMIPSAFYHLDDGIHTATSGKDLKLDVKNLRRISDSSLNILTAAESELAEIWKTVLGQPQLNLKGSDSFFDLGGSLKFVELADAISKYRNEEVQVGEILVKPTLSGMASLSSVDSKEFSASHEADKYTFSSLAREKSEETRGIILDSWNVKAKKNILLTGVTGYVGAYLLRDFIADDFVECIYCVIRAKNKQQANERVLSISSRRGISFGDGYSKKVILVCGDVAKPSLGIASCEYELLVSCIDVVVNAGAEVNMLKAYSALAAVNVGGTVNALEFAAQARAKHVFTSTMLPLPGEEATGYRKSKEVAELVCLRAQTELGVPSAVLQLGDIGISTDEGSCAPDDDYIVIFLRACVALNLFPHTDWAFSVMSVNDCSKMLTKLSLEGKVESFDGNAREVKGKLIRFDQLYTWISKDIPLHMCSLEGWTNAAKSGAADGIGELKRALLLLESMEVELAAEGMRLKTGEKSGEVDICVDERWGQSLSNALQLEYLSTNRDSATKRRDRTIAYAALSQGENLVPINISLQDMTSNSVEIKVTHCGLCGSDDHLISGDYGDYAVWPQVCGHEIVGIVTQVGNAVTHLKPGQRCGIGWQCSSCHDCEWCLRGNEQLCGKVVCTCCEGNRGGFANLVRIKDASFAFKIPKNLDSAEVAPLLCGGQTVWTPLKEQTKPGDRVGILGLGGLGHMAIKFAKAMGCEVTAISSSESKKRESIEHGAKHYVLHTDRDAMSRGKGTLDFILVTIATNQRVDFEKFFHLLRPRGTICFVGMCPPITADVFSMGFTMCNITTSNTGGRKDMIEMLDFCSRNGIRAWVKQRPLSKINDAIAEMRRGESSIRHVLVNDL